VYIVDWLEARRDAVPCLRPAPIHGDYHPGNVLLRADGSAVVIDWTGFAVSDPRFDLAWTMLLMGAHEDWSWRDRILAEYQRLIGAAVPQMEWFEVCACGRRLHNVLVSMSEGAEKLGMRPGAVESMKQQLGALQRVRDLLEARTGIALSEVGRLLASLA
jgi:aminoglycoside phosphotransferase (APT) family kinase protein